MPTTKHEPVWVGGDGVLMVSVKVKGKDGRGDGRFKG